MKQLVLGALAGVVATMAMTAAMRKMSEILPEDERYPLPPSELLERVVPGGDEDGHHLRTVSAHFAYGALAGALFSLLRPRVGGATYGVMIWALSYLGWIPAAGILRPATDHPARRNLLMLAVHLVWGRALEVGLRELDRSAGMFRCGGARDAPSLLPAPSAVQRARR